MSPPTNNPLPRPGPLLPTLRYDQSLMGCLRKGGAQFSRYRFHERSIVQIDAVEPFYDLSCFL